MVFNRVPKRRRCQKRFSAEHRVEINRLLLGNFNNVFDGFARQFARLFCRRLYPATATAQITSIRERKKEERRKLDSILVAFLEGTEGEKTFTAPEPTGFEKQSPGNFGSGTE